MRTRLRRLLFGRDLPVVYHPSYRLPLPTLEARTGFEPRRADHAMFYLLDEGVVGRAQLRTPRRADYAELALVHDAAFLESLSRPETLGSIFSVDPAEVRPDELMSAVRLACGGTIDAARECLRADAAGGPARVALNLLGGFHHAGPRRAGGFCPVNDVAVAIAVLRRDGFRGHALVLDLDAHPPDGTAECLREDPLAWIGSLSGTSWGPLDGVDETVLAEGTGDADYLGALDALLARAPRSEIAFVIAGGDVLSGDALGRLALTLEGVRRRDLAVAEALYRIPSVWLPGGGYSDGAWRALAGTGLALALRSEARIPERYDPLLARFGKVAAALTQEQLKGRSEEEDLFDALGMTRRRPLLLGFYSTEGLELALEQYGFLRELRRLGYGPFRLAVAEAGVGDRVQLFGRSEDRAEHLLVEVVLERRTVSGEDVLYLHWLTMRHPLARFSDRRPRLPGQEVPGLGLAKEMIGMLSQMALRLGLRGLAFRPASYHAAYAGRAALRFVDPARQGRFEASLRDLGGIPLAQATDAVANGRVRLNGQPYAWEPDEMVLWLRPHDHDAEAAARERERARFTLA